MGIKYFLDIVTNQPNKIEMKIVNLLKSTFVILLSLSSLTSMGQSTDPVVVTLTVDTSQLGTDRNAPGGCTLTANPGSVVISGDSNPKMFAIEVMDGTDMEWEGVTQTGEEVKIKKIGFLKGVNIFDSRDVPGRTNNGKEKVNAKIKRKTAPGFDYEYFIEFKVQGFGRYTLDPRIRVK